MMEKLSLLALLSVAGCSACAINPEPVALPGIPLELDPTLAIQAPNGSGGHACPVNGYVVSAAHVLYDPHLRTYVSAAWSDGRGGEGFAMATGGHTSLDIVILSTVGSSIEFLTAGFANVGDRVYWFEYDFRTKRNALRARRRFANVLRIVAGHYIVDEMPVGGASGTCLLNEKGEAVGIVVAGWETEDGLGVGSAAKLPQEIYESAR